MSPVLGREPPGSTASEPSLQLSSEVSDPAPFLHHSVHSLSISEHQLCAVSSSVVGCVSNEGRGLLLGSLCLGGGQSS